MRGMTLDAIFGLAGAALFGSTLAGTTGFGGAAVLLPILVHHFGVREAIPILTVAQMVGNSSRAWFHRRAISWRIVGGYAIGAIPMALLGGYAFAKTPPDLILRVLGGFLLVTVAWRWWGPRHDRKRLGPRDFAIVGGVFGFLSAIVGGVGPFIAPFFLAAGLVKGAYIGTEAMATVTMHVFKLIAYRQTSLLTPHAVAWGLSIGPLMILGSWFGKQIVAKLPEQVFVTIVEITLVVAGITFIL